MNSIQGPLTNTDAAPSIENVKDLFSNRAYNVIRRAGIHTIPEFLAMSKEDFRGIKSIGKVTVEELLKLQAALRHLPAAEENERPPKAGEPKPKEDRRSLSLASLSLSARAAHALKREGIETVEQLLALTHDRLSGFCGLGTKTVSEIEAIQAEQLARSAENAEEDCAAALKLTQHLMLPFPEAFTAVRQVQEANGAITPEVLYRHPVLQSALQKSILLALEKHDGALPPDALCAYFPDLENRDVQTYTLRALQEANTVAVETDAVGKTVIARQYPPVLSRIQSLPSEREKQLVTGRLNGMTLEELGTAYGITRERVRQILRDAFRRIRSRSQVREDRFRDFYQRYIVSEKDFTELFGEPKTTYYYLEQTYTRFPAAMELSADALQDESIPGEVRRKMERLIYRQYVMLDGQWVFRSRPALIDAALRRYAADAIPLSALEKRYTEMLEEQDLQNDPKLAFNCRVAENALTRSKIAICGFRHTVRHYHYEQYDFDEFLSKLDIEQYRDMALSALRIFRDRRELMEEYDIRSEYELHFLLKRILPPKTDPKVEFLRTPNLIIGSGDVESQLQMLLLEYAPVSAERLAALYEQRYGVKAATALSNEFQRIGNYYHDGMYTITAEILSKEEFSRMQELLAADFYTVQAAKQIFLREFPGADARRINPYTLKLLGFSVYSDYVVRSTYRSANQYFRELLTREDITDLRKFPPEMWSLGCFTGELYALRRELEIVEFVPAQNIHIRRLTSLGITREQLLDYIQAVQSAVPAGTYFTISDLRSSGFRHPLDEYGFEDWFCASLLIQDSEHFSYRRCGGTRLLYAGKKNVLVSEFLEEIIAGSGSISLADLTSLLEEKYDIRFAKDKLITLVRESQLYYDGITKKIYKDYSTYSAEVK